jgi:hypothetical protein
MNAKVSLFFRNNISVYYLVIEGLERDQVAREKL